METNSQQQGLRGWWQRRVEGVKNYFCPQYIVDPMPPPPWEVDLLLPLLACGLMGAVWLVVTIW